MSIKQTKNTALRLPVIRTTFRSKFGMSVIYQREITLTLFASQTVFFFFQSNFSLINSLNILSSCTTLGKCHFKWLNDFSNVTDVCFFFYPLSNESDVNSPFILRCKIHKQFLIIIYKIYIFQCRSL